MQKVIVLGFGSQYTQLIARKIRELGVYSEIRPFNAALAKIKAAKPAAIVLSGGPQSVYDKGAPLPSPTRYSNSAVQNQTTEFLFSIKRKWCRDSVARSTAGLAGPTEN